MDNIIKQINDTKLNADELAAKAALSFLIKSFKTTIDERALLENERDEYRKALEAILNNWDEHLPQPEQLKIGDLGDGKKFEYWSPSGAMIDTEPIAAARALLTKYPKES